MRASDKRFVFYTLGHRPPDVHSRCYVPVFTEAHVARAWLERMIGDKPFTRTDDIIWLSAPDFNFTIRCEQLDEVLNAPIANEPLRADIAKLILRFKYGTWDEVHTRDEPVDDADDAVTQRAPKPERQRRADAPPTFVTISDLCAGSNVLPTHARAALRASGRLKPAYGWAFAPADLPDIRKLIGIA